MVDVDAPGLGQLVLARAGYERGPYHLPDHAGRTLDHQRNVAIGRQQDRIAPLGHQRQLG